MLTAQVVLTAPLVDGVDDEGDELRVGVARVTFWAGAQVSPNETAGQASQDNLHMTIVGLERLSTSWGLRLVPRFLERPPIPRQTVSLSVGSLLYGV